MKGPESVSKKVKLSIITINYNDINGLSRTIQSVRNQSSGDFEFVIVDGGSTDGSKILIDENSDIVTRWVSEPDKGIYNAMNKGVQMASGDYVTFVNSGDELHDKDVVKDVLAHIESNPNVDIVFGKVLDRFENGEARIYEFHHELTLMSLYYSVVNHSGCFICRDIQLRHPYREDLKICSDRQFFIQSIILDNCSYGHINRVVTIFDKTGVSGNGENEELMIEENERIMNDIIPPRIAADYRNTNLMLQPLTSRMRKFQGLTKILVSMNLFIISAYTAIFKKK